jgi:hypothetical protein
MCESDAPFHHRIRTSIWFFIRVISYLRQRLKKTAAILLLLLMLFNWIGYWLVISYMDDYASKKMEARVDNSHYSLSELILVKVPTEGRLSYANNNMDFKRVNGEIEIAGIQYSYIKCRLYDDTLEFLCLPNTIATKLQDAKINLFKLVNDLQNNGQNKKSDASSNIAKSFSSEFYHHTNPDLSLFSICIQRTEKFSDFIANVPVRFPSSIDNPPEFQS